MDKYLKSVDKMSLDEVQQAFIDAIVINQFTNTEVAALLTSIMRNVLNMDGNAKYMANMHLDPSILGIDDVTMVQALLTKQML